MAQPASREATALPTIVGSLGGASHLSWIVTAYLLASTASTPLWADGVGPDGICMDADGAIWTGVGQFGDTLVGRVREGGEVLESVQLDLSCFACMLGGEDGKTLFMPAADWRTSDSFDENIARLTEGHPPVSC